MMREINGSVVIGNKVTAGEPELFSDNIYCIEVTVDANIVIGEHPKGS